MAYYLNLYSPDTYETFSKSDRSITGFRQRQSKAARRIHPGDILICYMTKLSRWVGLLEVTSEAFKDDTPFYYEKDDPFVIKFKVKPIVWLEKEKAIPIKTDAIWNNLSFTHQHEKEGTSAWTGILRSSLNRLDNADGQLLKEAIQYQAEAQVIHPIDEEEYKKLIVTTQVVAS